MTAGERFANWIEGLSDSWKDKLRGWLLRSIAEGATKFAEDMEPGAIDGVEGILLKLRDNPDCPGDLKALIDKVITPGNPLLIVVGAAILLLTMTGTLNALMAPVNRATEYKIDRLVESFRMDPAAIITAWRRDPTKYAWLLDDLDEQGWSEPRIEALKFLTQVIPNAADIVRFALREVYTPEIAEAYGQFQDIPAGAYPDAEKAGLSTDMFNKYWAAHWGLPSASDGFELLHRGILTEDQLKGLLKANDIMPYWRDQLIKLSWNIPTRVDVRRFWDMRTIDEARLREIYTGLGYHSKDLEDYVLWTKIYVDFPDLLARYKNGWITLDQVKSELIAMGMKPERADTLIEEKIKKAAPERVAAEKDLTKADIISGVKKGVITRVQAAELLTDIGYSNDEAVYLLDVNIPTDEETSVKTARELTKSDIIAGLKADVITEQDALNKLLELRYTATDAEFLLKIYKATASPPAEAKLKEASKADIVTAVKKGLITQEAGYMMLLDLGFAADAALFILSVATEESPFSPVTFDEFKDRTQKYRRAAGMEGKPMTEEIKTAGAEVIRLTREVESLLRSIKDEERKLIGQEILPAEATARLTEIRASLHRAESELARVKTDYNIKVAEWRHAIK